MHASVNTATFSIFGSIISHAYLVAGTFPDRIAFPVLAAALLGPSTVIPDPVLEESYVHSLSAHEAAILRDAANFTGLQVPI